MIVHVIFLGPKTKIRVIWKKKSKRKLGLEGWILWAQMEETSHWRISMILYQIKKKLGMLFHPRRYNLMSENILNLERNLFVYFYTFSY